TPARLVPAADDQDVGPRLRALRPLPHVRRRRLLRPTDGGRGLDRSGALGLSADPRRRDPRRLVSVGRASPGPEALRVPPRRDAAPLLEGGHAGAPHLPRKPGEPGVATPGRRRMARTAAAADAVGRAHALLHLPGGRGRVRPPPLRENEPAA